MPIDMNSPPSSYYQAIRKAGDDARKNGAIVKPGQFGGTIYQYPNYYEDCMGLVCVRNRGQWSPLKTFNGDLPDWQGIEGEVAFNNKGQLAAAFTSGKWRHY